jgi:hypothetical protein
VTLTMTNQVSAETGGAGSGDGQKDFTDFLSGIIPDAAQAVAPSLGLDPRVAGQTVSQILNIFGIGGPGKAFTPALPKDQALSQLQQVVTPSLSDPVLSAMLERWMQAALEPVQAQKEGKAYQPSVDLNKSWFGDAIDWVGHKLGDAAGDAASAIDWSKITSEAAQIGMQALPSAMTLLA